LRARAPRSPLGIALIACAVGVACSRPSAPEPERDEAAKSVPGLETALAEEATVRDEVRAAGAVAADVELPEARDTRALVAEAEARRQAASEQVARLRPLVREAIAPRKELEAAVAEETAATAAVERARAAHAALGGGAAREPLRAGESWMIAQVVQSDVARCGAGSEVDFAADAFPSDSFAGMVAVEAGYVDAASRLAPVAVRLSDPDRRLRPGMTGRVHIRSAPRRAVVVPRSAVVVDGDASVVFVAGEGGGFAAQRVEIGAGDGDRVEVARGLAAGARVVARGAASLLSAERLPAAGEGDE